MDRYSTLLIETAAGSQRVRSPRRTDAIGATLRDGYPVGNRLPDDIGRLLARLDDIADRVSVRG